MNTNDASGNFVDIPLDSESDKSQFDYTEVYTELIPGNASDVSDLTDYGDHDVYKTNDSVDAFIKSSSDEDEPVVLNELFANETNKCETGSDSETNKDNASLNVLTTISDTFVKIFYSMNNEDPSDYNNDDDNNNMSFDSVTNSHNENHFDNDSDNNLENEIDPSSNTPNTSTVFDDDWRSNFSQLELTKIDDNFRNKEIDDYYIEVSDSDND
jgi:hypothetical protein